MTAATPLAASELRQQRLVSLDALRGFDMFWILGMEQFAEALGRANSAPWAQFIAAQLDHAEWVGFHFLDLIFPLFVFVSGVSAVFSVDRSVEKRGRAGTARKIMVRALVLYAIGVIYYGHLFDGPGHIRWVGVLQRIALCGLAAGLLRCFCGARVQVGAIVVLLAGYWALMRFVPPPGAAPGDFAEGPGHNLANWLDARFLPGRKWDVTHDPEGLLSTLPAIATALIGVRAGAYLKRVRSAPAGTHAAHAWLIGAGVVLAAAGWAWHPFFPVIKKLWTSSYVLVSAGYSTALLGAFVWMIDVRARERPAWGRWAAPFVWIGMNPITLYLLERVARPHHWGTAWLGGPMEAALGAYGAVAVSALAVGVNVLAAWVLYRRGIVLRV